MEEERIQDQNEKIERLKFMQRLDAQMEQKVFIAKLYYLELILSNLFGLYERTIHKFKLQFFFT